MIGGSDITIDIMGASRSAVLDDVVRCIRRRWPDAVVVDGSSGTRFSSYRAVPFGRVSELLVYRDQDAFDRWMEQGADDETANTMIHAIAQEESVTLVVDDPEDGTMSSVIDATREILAPRNFWARAARAA